MDTECTSYVLSFYYTVYTVWVFFVVVFLFVFLSVQGCFPIGE